MLSVQTLKLLWELNWESALDLLVDHNNDMKCDEIWLYIYLGRTAGTDLHAGDGGVRSSHHSYHFIILIIIISLSHRSQLPSHMLTLKDFSSVISPLLSFLSDLTIYHQYLSHNLPSYQYLSHNQPCHVISVSQSTMSSHICLTIYHLIS